MDDRLIRDLRVPKMNSSSTMAEAADEIERLRTLITAWIDADDGSDLDAAGEFACARLALRQAVGR
jgi:hypothetical protein